MSRGVSGHPTSQPCVVAPVLDRIPFTSETTMGRFLFMNCSMTQSGRYFAIAYLRATSLVLRGWMMKANGVNAASLEARLRAPSASFNVPRGPCGEHAGRHYGAGAYAVGVACRPAR